ncbi:Mitochondrial chaperone Frataxin [Steccherinum ochraceum]|uniref:ferroxidase n=1 Tax=Steccherinum ochraceum TaxID=92696 RepID=A0A4R0RZN1_9APHY|nr:Mitochondrial chaperone Frataxin [Steccherinum ochraceum]
MFSRSARRSVSSLARSAPAAKRSITSLQRFTRTNVAQLAVSQGRHYATPAPQVKHSELSFEEYHAYADVTMEKLLESLEGLLDEMGNPEFEVEYSSGVLTLKLADKGTYVINKQPPNKQIWLSSPISGPKRYDYVPEENDWIYSRDASSMGELLNTELTSSLEQEVDLGINPVSQQPA